MKKTMRVLLIICVLFVFFILPIYLILVQAEIHWDVILFEFSIVILIMVVLAFISTQKYRKIIQCYNLNKRDEALIRCKKYLRWNPESLSTQNVHFIMALIFFDKNDDSQFESSIKYVEHKKLHPPKYYWMTLYLLTKDHLIEAKACYQNFLDSLEHVRKRSIYEKLESILKSIFDFIDHRDEETLFNLKETLKKTQSPRIKAYIERLL